MLKKVVSVLLSLCLLVGCAVAFPGDARAAFTPRGAGITERIDIDEIAVPEKKLTQDEMKEAFLGYVRDFVSPDLSEKAIKAAFSQNGQEMITALVEKLEDVFCVKAPAEGEGAFELQVGPEALWFTLGGEVYTLPYEKIGELLDGLSGGALGAVAGLAAALENPELFQRLGTLLVNQVLLHMVTIVPSLSEQHIMIHLDRDALLDTFIGFMDEVVADEELLDAVSAILEPLAALANIDLGGQDMKTFLSENWDTLREVLPESEFSLPFEVVIDLVIGSAEALSGALKLTTDAILVEAAFSMADGVITASGSAQENAEDPVVYGSFEFELNLLEGTFSLVVDYMDQTLTVDGAFGAGTAEIHIAVSNEEEGEVMQLNVFVTQVEDGWHLDFDYSDAQGRALYGRGDLYGNDELLVIDAAVYPEEEPDDETPYMAATFVYGLQTNAYTCELTRYLGYSTDYVYAEGTLTADVQTCDLVYSFGEDDEEELTDLLKASFSQVNGEDTYKATLFISRLADEDVWADAGSFTFLLDKTTGAFSGRVDAESMDVDRVDFSGILKKDLIQCTAIQTKADEFFASLEFKAVIEAQLFDVDFTYTDYYLDVTTGELLLTPSRCALSVRGVDIVLNAFVNLNAQYIPTGFGFFYQNYNADMPILVNADENGIDIIVGYQRYIIRGKFVDENTYDITVSVAGEDSLLQLQIMHIYLVAEEGHLAVRVASTSSEEDLYAFELDRIDLVDLDMLSEAEDITEVTPELIQALIGTLVPDFGEIEEEEPFEWEGF
ncbi:MAG: hypothetical protein J6U26_04300 [Lachnospiraceae bacterium]|nr:hypothetical protein [Lachnospiraceae bacterium]